MVDVGERPPGERLPCPACSAPVTVPSLDGPEAAGEPNGSPEDTHVLEVDAEFAEQAREAMSRTRTVKVTCGSCGKGLSVGARLSGRKVRCPNCRKTLRIPYPDDDEDDFHDLDEETAVHGEEGSLDLTGRGEHPEAKSPPAGKAPPHRPKRTATGPRKSTSGANGRRAGDPAPVETVRSEPGHARLAEPVGGGLSNRSLAALCALGVAVMLGVLSAPIWLRYLRRPADPADDGQDAARSALDPGADGARTPAGPDDEAGDAGEETPDANASPEANDPAPSDPPADPAGPGPPASGPGLTARLERIELDAFAARGRHPARPGYLYWRVSVRLEARAGPIELVSAGPDAVLVSMGMRIESLGSPDDASVLPMRARAREVRIEPGSPRSATFVFEVPQEFTRGRLVLAGGAELSLRAVRVRMGVPARRLAGDYVEALPRNLPPRADGPILAALRDAPGGLAVAARGEDLVLRFEQSGVEGLARPAGRIGGLYKVDLRKASSTRRARLRVLPKGQGLVLFLDAKPFHQITYLRPDARGRRVRVITPAGGSGSEPASETPTPAGPRSGPERSERNGHETKPETVEPQPIEPPRFFED